MDKEQNRIMIKICDKFHLPKDKLKFVQHRNLKEFRYFMIERINPNHVIQLYGKLKRPYLKDNHPNKIIKVGEILLSYSFLLFTTNSLMLNASLYFLATTLLSYLLYDIIKGDFEDDINAYWNRGKRWKWKNNPCSSLC